MNGLWLVSTLVLWGPLIAGGLVILALAREVLALHARLDALYKFISGADFGADGRERNTAIRDTETPVAPHTRAKQELS